MTVEQAKKVKVQKGYALEPILPGSLLQDEAVEGKRERKKSNLFGASPHSDTHTALSAAL